ncbi:DUF1524 domain-containing protein [Streptomyces sp. NPDC014864]|uniref:GmrSD restriction endonuclease domain-containing protein n=1 Tax=Streptomyces sp. NPDC014864 TaxID=3364924 RepID=UPI0036F7D87E
MPVPNKGDKRYLRPAHRPAAEREDLARSRTSTRSGPYRSLANLILRNRTKNSYAQNYDFADKKVKCFTGRHRVSTFALTSQVLHHPQWTPQLLHKWQQHLLGLLADEWDL